MSSFTFSSEPDVEKCVSDKPLSVWTLVFVVFSVFVGFSLSDYISSLYPVGAANIRYETVWDDIEVVILGDSSEAAAIDQTLLAENSLNVSVSGSGYSAWKPVFRGVVSRTPNLRYIVMSCDPMSRLRDGLTPRGDDLSDLVLRGAFSADLDGVSPVVRFETFLRYETFLATVLSKPKAGWVDLIRWLTAADYLPVKAEFKYSSKDGALKKREYIKMFERQNSIESNEAGLQEMLSLIEERGIQLVLVRTPVTREFKAEDELKWESHYERIQGIVDEQFGVGEVPTFDGSMMFADDLDKFNDPNHVNAGGRTLFTERLNNFISSHFATRDEASPQ
jgi:hypothetical protein